MHCKNYQMSSLFPVNTQQYIFLYALFLCCFTAIL
uniref:Uncharacterized protein n=1 Tax=Setaria italica TaxID=4555 RepID=K3ZPU6_SETIT